METNTHKNFSIKEAIKYGLNTYTEHMGLMLGATGLYLLYLSSFVLAGYGAYKVLSMFAPNVVTFTDLYNAMSSNNIETIKQFFINLKNNPKDMAAIGGSIALASIWSFIVSALGMAGLTKIALNLFEHGSAQLSDFFVSCSEFWRYFKASMLFLLAIGIGFGLLVIPGFWAMIAFFFAPIIALDSSLRTIPSFKQSMEITKGVRWKLFFIVIGLSLASQVIGSIFSFVNPFANTVFSFVLLPLSVLIWVYVYRTLKIQTPNLPV